MGKIKFNNYIVFFVFIPIACIVGYIIRCYCQNFSFFVIKKEIDLLNILSLLTTIIIAILVSIVISKEREKDRIKKNLIIKRIDDLVLLIDSLHKSLFDAKIKLTSIFSILKRINTTMNCLKYICCKIDDSDNKIEKNMTLIKEIKTDLTYTEIKKNIAIDKSMLPIYVEDDFCHYSPQRIQEVETKIEKLKNQLFNLQIFINEL